MVESRIRRRRQDDSVVASSGVAGVVVVTNNEDRWPAVTLMVAKRDERVDGTESRNDEVRKYDRRFDNRATTTRLLRCDNMELQPVVG